MTTADKQVTGASTMARVTINKVNERINQHGFELVRGKGYYYFSRTSADSPIITEEGIYGTPYLNAWTIDQLERMLLERIEESKSDDAEDNPFIIKVTNHLDNK
jgi:hypothetical protein